MKQSKKQFYVHTRCQMAILLFVVSFFVSCQQLAKQEIPREQKYQYIEINKQKGFGSTTKKELDPEIIKAYTDSAAYLKAYESFCISLKVWKEMEAGLGYSYSTPTDFKLLNEAGEDIAGTIHFQGKEEHEIKIAEKVFSMKTGIKESIQEAVK